MDFPRPDVGEYIREWMSSSVNEKLKGYVRLSQFDGNRSSLVTKEVALEYEKREETYINVGLDEFDPTDFYQCKLEASVNERLQVLSQEFLYDKHYLTGNELAETLFSLQMLNEREMKIMESKDENFLRTFSAHEDADVEEEEMNRSEYSSKYAFCIYHFRSYDLRDLSRWTRKECVDEYQELKRTKKQKFLKAFQLLNQNGHNC